VDALARRLVQVLENPELARRLGEAGRARAERHFTWPAVIGRMTAVMESVLASRAGSG
jgi:glycosyltransferase involved in cell wall biosynthesis